MRNVVSKQKLHKIWPALIVCLGVSCVFILIEQAHPYFFLQDDNRVQYLPYFAHNYRAFKEGQIALYNFHQFLGTPHLSNGNSAALYPLTILGAAFSELFFGHLFATIEWIVYFHMIIGALGFFVMSRILKLSTGSAMFSALTWPLISYFLYIGNSWFIATAAVSWLPWLVALSLLLFERKKLRFAVGLALIRILHFFAGHPQFFIYSAIFEFFFIELIWVSRLRKPLSHHDGWADQARYAFSYLLTLIGSLPLLLPLYRQMTQSYRSGRLDWKSFQQGSTVLNLWWSGLMPPYEGHIFQSISFIGWVGLILAALALVLAVLSLLPKSPFFRKRRGLLWITIVLSVIAFTWAGNIGPINRLIYEIPFLNQFRWPYKVLIQFYFFIVLLIALAFDEIFLCLQAAMDRLSQRHLPLPQLFAVILLLVQIVSFAHLYTVAPIRGIRVQEGDVPWDEPLELLSEEGRIISVGFDYTKPYIQHTLAFDMATFWELDQISGYEALLPAMQQRPQKGFGLYSGYYDDLQTKKHTLPDRLEDFRRLGVRYYVVNPAYVEWYGEPPLKRILEEKNRIIFEDPIAAPYLHIRDENATPISYQIERSTNKMAFVYTLDTSREVIANFLPDPNLSYLIDGQKANAHALEDQIVLTLPGGSHRLEILYVDRDFHQGLFLALSVSLILCVLWRIWFRNLPTARKASE